MNTNNVVSAPVAADLSSGKEHLLVKMTSTGIDIAASTDRAIGTLHRGNVKALDGGSAVGLACDVFLTQSHWVGYAVLGATTAAIALGATLAADSANAGKLVPSGSNVIAIAWQALTGASGTVMRVLWVT